MVLTKKFSEFVDANLADPSNELVGLSGGVNAKSEKVTEWSTSTRPSPPFDGLMGFNTTLGVWEYYSVSNLAWIQFVDSASFTSTYIVQVPDPNLPNAQALSTLSTGILKSTTTTGVVSISPSLTSIDALTTAADEMIYTTASNTYATTGLTSFARSLLDDANAAAARSTLGLGQAAVKDVTDNTQPLVASVFGAFTIGHMAVAKDVFGTLQDGGAPSTGSVTQINTGTGLTGGPITSTGTILFDDATNNTILANISGGNAPSIPNTLTAIIDACIGGVQGNILYRNGTVWTVLAPGVSGQLLQTQGAGSDPLWATSALVTPAALTRVDDTNVTLTLGGSPSTALLQATSLTLGWSGQLSATRGGTGIGTYTTGDILYSSAANTLSKLAGNTTVVKQYLSQTGDGVNSAAPAWATISGSDITGAALTKTDDTNVTLTLGGSPSTALLRAASLTLGWTGQLSLTRGGTNASLTASNGGIVYSTATAMAILAGTATAGQILRSGSSAAPSWSTATYPATAGTSGNVLTSDGTNWVSSPPASTSSLTTNHIFVGNASNVATDVAMSGDATIVASGALTIANSAVTNAKMANMADQTIKGNVSGGSAAPSDLTKSQVLTMLGNAINQINTQTITTTGAFTYTPTTGTKYAIFELQGAGGGCGGTTGTGGQSAISGAGGGGAYIKLLVSGSTNLAAITGSVGAGGTAGSSGNNSGGTGGSTTLVINGGSTWTAAGGIGGTGKTSSASSQQSGTPADGGTATNGTNGTAILSLNGGQGDWGASFGNVNYWASAAGGNSILSAANGNAQTTGGTKYGSGSPGFFNFTGANAAGQAGANGVVVITEFISA